MSNCRNCRFRAHYDRNPKSLLGKFWKWHTGWCPGWKSYLNSVSAEEKQRLLEKYGGRSTVSRDRVSR